VRNTSASPHPYLLPAQASMTLFALFQDGPVLRGAVGMIRLIVADDHVVIRQALCEMLEARGKYEVIGQASTGAELLRVLANKTPDVIILDVAMPELGGVEALQLMPESRSGKVPALVLSADSQPRNVKAAIQAGARGYLPKDVEVHEIEFAIDTVLKGNTYLSPSITKSFIENSGSVVASPNPLEVLSERELEVLRLLADGRANRQIGKLLGISTRTVDTHRSNILKKLAVKTNAELVKVAIARGVVSV
jgi:DNA-binding NarL/FixJ family response regulator